MAIGFGVAVPKPESRQRTKGRKDRREAAIAKIVRAKCVDRDGHCRWRKDNWTACVNCDGPSEWAHYGARRRAQTRGQLPELRHTTMGSLMLCQKHHAEYDARKLRITALGANGCDGELRYGKAR